MSKLCAYRGALATAALSLALGAQAQVIEITIDAGSQTSPTVASCTGFDLLFSGNDCTYNDSSAVATNWVGPRSRDGFYTLGTAQSFANTGIPAGATGIALSGTLEIVATGTCAEHTISGTIVMAPFTRNFAGNNVRQVENFAGGITQTLVEKQFDSGVANASGGCDYTLGSAGVPELITGNYGDFPGNPPGGVQPGADPALAWTAPATREVSRQSGITDTPNTGAQAIATIGAGYECLNNNAACASGAPPATPGVSGGFSFAWNAIEPALANPSQNPTQKASWNNITGNLSTNAAGDLEAFLYVAHDDFEVGTFAGQRTSYWAYTVEILGTGPGGGGPLPPVANDDTATVNQDQSVQIDVLANDTNLTNPVTVTITTPPTNGSAVVNGSPGAAAGVSITYTPDAGYNGSDSFVYNVSDENDNASALVTITVNQVGANDDTATTRLNVPVTIDVLANDVGFDDPVTVSIVLAPDNGGSAVVVDSEGNVVGDGTGEQGDLRIRFTPNAALGTPTYTENFTYEVSSGNGGGEQVFVFSRLVQDVAFGIVDSDTSANLNVTGGSATVSEGVISVTGVAWEALNPNASAIYSSDWSTALGEDVTVTKIDESCDQAPDTAGSACGGPRGLVGDWIPGELQDGSLSGTPTNRAFVDGDVLTIVRETEFVECPGGPAPACGVPGVFPGNNVSITTFTFVAAGAGVTDTATVTVTVNNALPVANDTTVNVPDAAVRAVNPNTLGQQVNVATLAGNLLGDAPATVTVGAVTNGTASVSGDIVTVTPNATFFVGSVTAEYTITDADGEADTGVITVAIPDVAPTLDDGSGSLQTGQSATVALAFEGGNGSVAQHTLAVTTQATSGSCELVGASVVYTAGTEAGSFSCVVTLTDGDGDADTGTFSFTVTAPPQDEITIRLPGGSSSMDLLGLALLAGLPLLRRRRRLS